MFVIGKIVGLGRRRVAKLIFPASSDEMYVLVDEDVSVFQKTGILASAIYIVSDDHELSKIATTNEK